MQPKKMCGAAIVILGTITGFAMLAVGLSATLGTPNPAADFSVLSSKCAIVGVYHETMNVSRHNHATKNTDTSCHDVYTYEFAWCAESNTCTPATAPSTTGDTTPRTSFNPAWSSAATEVAIYRGWWTSFPPPAAFANSGWESALLVSEPDSINRAGSGACPSDGSGAQSSTYAAGEWVTCYQPASATVDAAYVCGNAGCIKLFDPSADLTLARRNSNEALYFGAAVAAIFSLFWLCMWWQNGFSCRSFMCGDDEEDSDDEEEAK